MTLDSLTLLAARHLDETEGPVQVGRVLTATDRSAINTLLRYVSRMHNGASTACPRCSHRAHPGRECGAVMQGMTCYCGRTT